MASGSSSKKSIFKGKGLMHGDNIFLNTDAYNEFFQSQSYVYETYHHLSLIIFEPTPTNPMESQFQNIPHHDFAHFEISDDSGDENAQEMHKKSNLFEIYMKKVEKSDGTKIDVCKNCSKNSSGQNLEVTTLIKDMSILCILQKLRSQSQDDKLKLQLRFPLILNNFVTLVLIIEKN